MLVIGVIGVIGVACRRVPTALFLFESSLIILILRISNKSEGKKSYTIKMPSKLKKELAACNRRLGFSVLACLENFPFTDTKDWFDVATFHDFLSKLGVHFERTHLSKLLGLMKKDQLQCNTTNKKKTTAFSHNEIPLQMVATQSKI